MKMTFPRFAIFLAIVLAVWFWPSIFGGKVLLPTDLLWQHPPHTPPAGAGTPHNPLIGDMLYENFSWKTLLRRCAERGSLPLWNPYSFCGHPLYATGQTSTFYPFNAIFLLVPLPQAYVVYTVLHLWLAGAFTYLFLRQIGVDGFGSAIGGTVFALCGFLAMRLIWPMLLGSAIWLPLMLWWIFRGDCPRFARREDELRLPAESALRERPAKGGLSGFCRAAGRIGIGAVIFTMPLLSGFFEIAFYGYFVAGLFTLARCVQLLRADPSTGGQAASVTRGGQAASVTRRFNETGGRRSGNSLARCAGLCGQMLAAVVIAVMLAGPQLLPFWEVKNLSTRVGEADYEKMVGRALKPEHLLEMLVPDIFGNPAKHEAWDMRTWSMLSITARQGADFYSFGTKNYSENGYYLGLLPLGLAILSLRGRASHRWFLWGLLILSLCLAFGTRAYALFYHLVPGFEQVRTPFRWMYPATFAVACLAAMGAQYWLGRLAEGRGTRGEGRGERQEPEGSSQLSVLSVQSEGGTCPRKAVGMAPEQDAAHGSQSSGTRESPPPLASPVDKTTGINPVARQDGGTGHPRRWLDRLIGVALVGGPVVMLVVVLSFLTAPNLTHNIAARALDAIPSLSQRAGFRDPWDVAGFMWANALRLALLAVAAGVILALPYLRFWTQRGAGLAALCCLVLTAIDPLQANGSFMTQAHPVWLERMPPAVRHLQADTDVFRVARFGRQMVLHPNLPVLYGLQDIGGYDSIILGQYARYLGAIEPQRAVWHNQIRGFEELDSLDSPLLPLLNIRYLLCDPHESVDHPDWELVFSEGMKIYRNRRERPRGFMVHQAETVGSLDEALAKFTEGKVDPTRVALIEKPAAGLPRLPSDPAASTGQVKIAAYEPGAVELTTSSEAPGILVLCDIMYPGWRAYVDGQPADILKTDGIFRGVYVPAGRHRVWFRFQPASLRNGVILLCCGGLILGAVGVVACLRTGILRSRAGKSLH